MMRGRRFVACAVRDPQGTIVTVSEPIAPAIYASRWSKLPFLRAMTILWDTLVLGTKMLLFSANIAVQEDKPHDHVESKPGSPTATPAPSQGLPAGVAFGTLAVSLTFGIGLFFVLPLVLVNFADPYLATWLVHRDATSLASNLLEGAIRLSLFLAYLWAISLMPDVRRVFQYHGAEHKTIAAEEAGAALTPETIQKFSKAHPRCGTGFLLTVVVVSILVFVLLGQPPLVLRIVSRIVLIPVVAALSYELIKFSSAHQNNPVLEWLVVKPSLALQGFTTREPDDQMIQVAVAALHKVQAEENASQRN
ncbi:MAG: DUF1385 domain-containing protein [Chloroflexi bacterium]|nr:DUF1385 domain-containing protein [Chloroflexota bacterium]